MVCPKIYIYIKLSQDEFQHGCWQSKLKYSMACFFLFLINPRIDCLFWYFFPCKFNPTSIVLRLISCNIVFITQLKFLHCCSNQQSMSTCIVQSPKQTSWNLWHFLLEHPFLLLLGKDYSHIWGWSLKKTENKTKKTQGCRSSEHLY